MTHQPGGGGLAPGGSPGLPDAVLLEMDMDAAGGSPYEIARKSVEALDPADQFRLLSELSARLSGELGRRPRSLMELEGLGQEVWQGLDVDDYIRQERSSWDG